MDQGRHESPARPHRHPLTTPTHHATNPTHTMPKIIPEARHAWRFSSIQAALLLALLSGIQADALPGAGLCRGASCACAAKKRLKNRCVDHDD